MPVYSSTFTQRMRHMPSACSTHTILGQLGLHKLLVKHGGGSEVRCLGANQRRGLQDDGVFGVATSAASAVLLVIKAPVSQRTSENEAVNRMPTAAALQALAHQHKQGAVTAVLHRSGAENKPADQCHCMCPLSNQQAWAQGTQSAQGFQRQRRPWSPARPTVAFNSTM